MWGDRYLKNKLRLLFRNSLEVALVLTESLKISVISKYCTSVGELMSEFSLPKLGGICGIISSNCHCLK